MLFGPDSLTVREARKRVIFKRKIREILGNEIAIFIRNSEETEALKAVYFRLTKGYQVQIWTEPRKKFKKWDWDQYYPYIEADTIKGALGRS